MKFIKEYKRPLIKHPFMNEKCSFPSTGNSLSHTHPHDSVYSYSHSVYPEGYFTANKLEMNEFEPENSCLEKIYKKQ